MAYVIAVPVGSLVLGLVLYSFHHIFPVPQIAAGWLVLSIAAMVAFQLRIPKLESRWRVPRSWARFGHVWYATLFGLILGFGLVTAIPSAGLYAVVTWALAANGWGQLWPV